MRTMSQVQKWHFLDLLFLGLIIQEHLMKQILHRYSVSFLRNYEARTIVFPHLNFHQVPLKSNLHKIQKR